MADQMENEKRAGILEQVNEMFGTTLDSETIFCVVDSCNWKLEDSIDRLIELTSIEASGVCQHEGMTKEYFSYDESEESFDDEDLLQMSNPNWNNTWNTDTKTENMCLTKQSLKLDESQSSDWILVKRNKHSSGSNSSNFKLESTKFEGTIDPSEGSLSCNTTHAQNVNQSLANMVPTSLVPSTYPANDDLCTNCLSDKGETVKDKSNKNCISHGQMKGKNNNKERAQDNANDAEKCDDAVFLRRYQNEVSATQEKMSMETSSQLLSAYNAAYAKSSDSTQKTAYDRILEDIMKGYKILILMRGASGSGKSYLAKTIVSQTVGGNPGDYIYSTDDYFVNFGRGRYVFDPSRLQDAHTWNQERTWASLKKGISPVIIDNTNIQLWEMRPYAAMAVNTGYNVEVLRCNTPWCFDVDKLSMKNSHGVPKAKIRQMIQRFEDIADGSTLLHTFRLIDDTVKKPNKLRSIPPLNVMHSTASVPPSGNHLNNLSRIHETNENSTRRKMFTVNSANVAKTCANHSLDQQCKTKQNNYSKNSQLKLMKVEASTITTDKDFNFLRVVDSLQSEYKVINSRGRDINNALLPGKNEAQNAKSSMLHKSCETDELSYELIEANDTADSMRKIKEMFTDVSDESLREISCQLNYDCDRIIDFLLEEKEHFFFSQESKSECNANLTFTTAVVPKSKYNRFRFLSDSSNSSDDDVHGHVQTLQQSYLQKHSEEDVGEISESKCTDCTEMIELNIGKDILRVLQHEFGSPESSFPENRPTIVRIKRTWARVFYELCVKSAHNQLDSERKRLDQIKKDAEYAKLLDKENPENEAHCAANPDGFTQYIGAYRHRRRSNLKKLRRIFPNFNKKDLNQILMAHNGNLEETVDVIKASTEQPNLDESVERDSEFNENESADDYRDFYYKKTLKDAREAREKARIHLQLRNENMRKARNICKKDRTRALLYAELAQEHAHNMDKANATAATGYLAAQTYVLNQENILDLHHLYVPEAMTALSVFLDFHIKKLQNEYEDSVVIYIITGWGAHSSNGHSKIKEAVGKKLIANNISFINDNPGRFKVTLEKDTQYNDKD